MAEMNPPVDTTKQAREVTLAAGQKVSDATIDASSAAVDAATHAGKRAAESMPAAARSLTGMVTQTVDAVTMTATQAVDVATEVTHDAKASTMPLMDIYRDAARQSADRIQALFGTWMTVSRGMHELQLKLLETMTRSMETTGGKPFEVWQAQRDLYISAVDTAFASTSRMLETASQSVISANQPPETRH